MSDYADTIGTLLSSAGLALGRVSKAPADETQGLEVVVDAIDPRVVQGPMPWPGVRGDGVLPSVDDRVLVAQADDGYWCIAWWPYS